MNIIKTNISLPFLALICIISLTIFCNSATLHISKFYFPVFLPCMFIGLLGLFKYKIKARLEHYIILALLFVSSLNINEMVTYIQSGYYHAWQRLLMQALTASYFFIFSLYKPSLQELRAILNSFIVAGVLYSIYFLLFHQYIGEGHYALKVFLRDDIETMDPNFLAAFLCIPTTILFQKLISHTKKRWENIFLLLLILSTTFWTGSRAALLASIISFSCILLINRKHIVGAVVIILLSSCAVYAILPQEVINRFFIASYIDPSNSARIYQWETALDIALHSHLWFGHGLIAISSISSIGSIHNTWILILFAFGILGLSAVGLCFLKFFIYIFKRGKSLGGALLLIFIFLYAIIDGFDAISFWHHLLLLSYLVNFIYDHPDINLTQVL